MSYAAPRSNTCQTHVGHQNTSVSFGSKARGPQNNALNCIFITPLSNLNDALVYQSGMHRLHLIGKRFMSRTRLPFLTSHITTVVVPTSQTYQFELQVKSFRFDHELTLVSELTWYNLLVLQSTASHASKRATEETAWHTPRPCESPKPVMHRSAS